MTIGAGTPVGDGRIGTARRDWMRPVVLGGLGLVFLAVLQPAGEPGFAFYWLVYGVLTVAGGRWIRTFGVDLTPDFARVRGFRQRSVAWRHVQAVVRHKRLGTGVVRLLLESVELVTLKAPTWSRGSSTARCEREFHLIGECWLAPRGQSWRPQRPEAPRLPAAAP
jgi:hypothetical protein